MKLLIIEDVPETLALLKWRAEKNSFDCQMDDTGSQWRSKLQMRKPDAVLLDMNLPLMSGLGILREMRQHKEWNDIPVFILSGVVDDEVRKEAIDMGATAYFAKDEDVDDIFRRIHRHLVMPRFEGYASVQ